MIDLRTDAMTPPTNEMWEVMRQAELGWAIRGEDAHVNELERLGAEVTGKETAFLVPTCSAANLLALMTLGERGTQAVVGSTSHIACSEEWGIAHICGLFPRLVPDTRGIPDPTYVEEAIAEAEMRRLPRTSLVCLENSHNNAGGIAATPEQIENVAAVARRYGAALHLDGARLFNSAAALDRPVSEFVASVDTVALSLNKGLCAPFGTLLCGRSETIQAARRNARRIGASSVHKAGIYAAAGIVALTTMRDRLPEDNRRAKELARRLSRMKGLHIDMWSVQTNIVIATLDPSAPSEAFVERLAEEGVLAYARPPDRVRFVTHRLIGDTEIETAIEAVGTALGLQPPPQAEPGHWLKRTLRPLARLGKRPGTGEGEHE